MLNSSALNDGCIVFNSKCQTLCSSIMENVNKNIDSAIELRDTLMELGIVEIDVTFQEFMTKTALSKTITKYIAYGLPKTPKEEKTISEFDLHFNCYTDEKLN